MSLLNNLICRRRRIYDTEDEGVGVAKVLMQHHVSSRSICHKKLSHSPPLINLRIKEIPPMSKEKYPVLQKKPSQLDTVPLGACRRKSICSGRRVRKDPFGNLPDELMRTILSKLEFKEVVRTSILSSRWRRTWTLHSKIILDSATLCGGEYKTGMQRYVQSQAYIDRGHHTLRFIDNVNKILHHHRGNVVEEFAVKFPIDGIIANHINDWIIFAMSSRTKSLILDLVPTTSLAALCPFPRRLSTLHSSDLFVFPFQLLDGEIVSLLQHIQLSYVSFKVPSHFIGFPNLRKLDLCLVVVSTSGIVHLLSNCRNIEWLHMDRCPFNGEFKVDTPLPFLLYLHLENCRITKIEVNAMKLTNFVYKGRLVPINLGEASELDCVSVDVGIPSDLALEKALSSLPDVFSRARCLTLCGAFILPKVSSQLENAFKFFHLRYLWLVLYIRNEDTDNMISLAYFLEAAPFLENFEVQFVSTCSTYAGDEPLRSLTRNRCHCLKDVRIYGFRASKSQIELLLHILDSAPALEILTVDPTCQVISEYPFAERGGHEQTQLSLIRDSFTKFVSGVLSLKTRLNLM